MTTWQWAGAFLIVLGGGALGMGVGYGIFSKRHICIFSAILLLGIVLLLEFLP